MRHEEVKKKDGSNSFDRVMDFWRNLKSYRETNLTLFVCVFGILLTILSRHFFSRENLVSIANGMTADGIIAVGMTMALACGVFDFSVGSVMALSGVVMGILQISGVNIWVSLLVGLLAGIFCGFLNGYFVGKVGLNPFITSIAVGGIARGAAYAATQGSTISITGVPDAFVFLGAGQILGIPVIVILFIIIAIIADFMMRRSEPLRKVYYTGSNEKTAILSGINTARVKMGVFLVTALLAGLAGVLSTARFTVATPTAGAGAEIRTIAAAILGGASLNGGQGTVFGTVLGLILLNLVSNGLIIMNVPVYWQDLINGIILLSAVAFDYISHRRTVKKPGAV